MISFLRGTLSAKSLDHAVIDVGGVGFQVWISLTTYRELPREKEPLTLHTALVLREDDIKLYGFYSQDERELFHLLTSLSGIGAKMALDILSHTTIQQIVDAVQKNQPALLGKIPGIGKKRAERLVFDLRQIQTPLLQTPASQLGRQDSSVFAGDGPLQEAMEALQALGLKPQEAQKAVASAVAHLGEDASVQDLIREGLKRR